ncbi:hypothetical protein X975_13320, partial [Stegodyphus mimosarum]
MTKDTLFLKLRWFSTISFFLSMITVIIEACYSRDYKDDLIRILTLYVLTLWFTDGDFLAYVTRKKFDNCLAKFMFDSGNFSLAVIFIFLQWVFNVYFLDAIYMGKDPTLF